MGFEDELRLAYAVALNAIALLAAYRFARRRTGGDVVRRLIDAGLIYYLLQYAVIGALGVLGLLSPWTVGPLALMLCALLWVGSGWRRDANVPGLPLPPPTTPPTPPDEGSRLDRATFVACFAFVAAYALAFIHQQRFVPPIADDALTYHLPAAVQWLQTGRIGLFPTWFFNPANTYSPLAGSMFMAWLMAPVGSDVLVRYLQLGPFLLLFLVLVEVGRLLGARGAAAALVATACVMTRSFVNQVIVPKDDLFLTVFCVAAAMSLAARRVDERGSPWRAGAAIGLLLATKYTAMFSLPILLLMADVPLRSPRWRRGGWAVALAVVIAVAGPWYLRNAMLTGNPLFPIDVRVGDTPILRGLFATTRSAALRTPGGVVDALVRGQGFYGPPLSVVVALLLAWGAFAALRGRSGVRDPLWRACVLGSVLSVALFAAAAPYAEVRFVYPALALLFACAAGAIGCFRGPVDVLAAVVLLGTALFTTVGGSADKQGFALVGCVAAAAATATGGLCLTPARHAWRLRVGVILCVVVVVAGIAFVNWTAYVRQYEAGRADVWPQVHGDVARAWAVVDREAPPGSTIAYSNVHFVYPLQGTRLSNRVVYVSSRADLDALHDLPRAPEPLMGEQIPAHFTEAAYLGADATTWRSNLVASGADFLFVGKTGNGPPPELAFIAERPVAFERMFDDDAASVFRVRDRGALAD